MGVSENRLPPPIPMVHHPFFLFNYPFYGYCITHFQTPSNIHIHMHIHMHMTYAYASRRTGNRARKNNVFLKKLIFARAKQTFLQVELFQILAREFGKRIWQNSRFVRILDSFLFFQSRKQHKDTQGILTCPPPPPPTPS